MGSKTRDPTFFHGRGCQSGLGGTVQSDLERKTLSVFHGRQHLSIPRRIASTRGRVQCHASSGHWHGTPRRDVEQRGSRVEPFVREMVEPETHPSHLARGGSSASEQSPPHLRERVFARVDRRSVCGASRDPGSPSHLQDSRMGWIARGRYVLQGGFAKVQLTDDALFRIEKVLKRQKGQMLVKWQGWPDKYNSWIPSQALATQKKTRKRKRP